MLVLNSQGESNIFWVIVTLLPICEYSCFFGCCRFRNDWHKVGWLGKQILGGSACTKKLVNSFIRKWAKFEAMTLHSKQFPVALMDINPNKIHVNLSQISQLSLNQTWNRCGEKSSQGYPWQSTKPIHQKLESLRCQTTMIWLSKPTICNAKN